MRPSSRFLPAFPEEWLCRVRERPDLLRQPFRTLDGRTIRILDPGTANPVDGPDFLDATIEEDGRPRRGSVEFHFRTSDWYAHRHHTDPRYNGVVLHVVLNHSLPDLYVHTEEQGRAPIVELRTHLRIPVGDLANSLASAPKKWDCPLPHDAPAEDVRMRVIAVLGDVRFLRKAEAAGEQRRLLGEDEAVYRMLADALGYANNREPFGNLVDLVPLDRLRGLGPVDAEAMLLGSAGFLATSAPDAHTQHLQRRWAALDGRKETLLREQWRFSRSRQGNTPVRRVVALAGLVSEFGGAFVPRFRGISMQGDADGGWRPRWRSVQVTPAAYWAERLDVGKPSLTKARYLVGETRARDVWVNVVLPMLVASGDAARGEETRRRAIDLYHGHPSLQSNYKTRWVAAQALRLPDKADAKQQAKIQQGMLELYDGFCEPRRCFECPIQAARAVPT